MKITVAHSPDSDDAFMFYGLASGAVDTHGFAVEQVLADIETLNRAAFEGRYEVTAVSFHAYAHLLDKYVLLPHGASMGDRYGPILVARDGRFDAAADGTLAGARIAIPGRLTSAFLALQLYVAEQEEAAPEAPRLNSGPAHGGSSAGVHAPRPDALPFNVEVIPFDQIQRAVIDGRVDAGLLIHEGQLTYASEGLRKVVDLGEWWHQHTGGLPLPLGGNVIRRDLGSETRRVVSAMLHESIAHALSHRGDAVEYARQFGRGLDRAETDRFVGMYVNQLTLHYGDRGRAALRRFFDESFKRRLIPTRVPVQFSD